jgi:hypothetical protein
LIKTLMMAYTPMNYNVVALMSHLVFMTKPSIHRMHDPRSIISHIRPKVFTDN